MHSRCGCFEFEQIIPSKPHVQKLCNIKISELRKTWHVSTQHNFLHRKHNSCGENKTKQTTANISQHKTCNMTFHFLKNNISRCHTFKHSDYNWNTVIWANLMSKSYATTTLPNWKTLHSSSTLHFRIRRQHFCDEKQHQDAQTIHHNKNSIFNISNT